MKEEELLEEEINLYSFRIELKDCIQDIINKQLLISKKENWSYYPDTLNIEFNTNGELVSIIDYFATLEISNKGKIKIIKNTAVYTGNQEDYQIFLVRFLKEIQYDIMHLILE